MLAYLLKDLEIITLQLPSKLEGNYWLSYKNENINLLNIQATNGKWLIN